MRKSGALEQKPFKLICSVIFSDEDLLSRAEKDLVGKYGSKEPLESVYPFDYTDYYEEEFGPGLKRKLICFQELVSPDESWKIKTWTNGIEDNYSVGPRRRVNIDPGYVTEAKLVLFTTKDYSHRIYLGDRIFAEVTLFYSCNSFKAWPWTYPDYASPEMIGYFNKVRAVYVDDIKKMRGERCS